MLCDKCKSKEAVVKIVQIINGVKTEKYLCKECAKEEQTFAKTPFASPIGEFMSSFLNFVPSQQMFIEQGNLQCDKCGLTAREFQKEGRLGCAHCYEVFKDSLMPLIRQVHGQTDHRGHNPPMTEPDNKRKIRQLQEQLRVAVIEERYEDAAVLRDQIRQMEV